MARSTNLVDDYLFRDGRTSLFKSNAPLSAVTNAVERQATRDIRRRVQPIVRRIAIDIGNAFGKRTGEARRTLRYGPSRITGSTYRNLRVRIVGPEYIRTIDVGGTIKPTKGRFLAIPIPPPFGEGARADGTPRLPGPRSWKGIRNTFVFKSKNGNYFIAYSKARQGPQGGKGLVLLYSLVEEVELAGKNRIEDIYTRGKVDIAAIVSAEIAQAFFQYVDTPRRHLLPLARITTRGRGRR